MSFASSCVYLPLPRQGEPPIQTTAASRINGEWRDLPREINFTTVVYDTPSLRSFKIRGLVVNFIRVQFWIQILLVVGWDRGAGGEI